MMTHSNWHSYRPSLLHRIIREIGYTISGKNHIGEAIYGGMIMLAGIMTIVFAGAVFG